MRKLFGTDGVRGLANEWPMTPEMALQLGQAAAVIFRNHHRRQRVMLGKDTRLSGYMIEQALASGICSMGGDVYLVGPMPTPGIAFLTANMRADAGIVISGSHNSFEDNGIKFFSGRGFKLPDEMELQMENLILGNQLNEQRIFGSEIGKAHRLEDALGRYIVFLKNTFPANLTLDGLKIVLDCAHGSAYKVAPAVLEELGAEVFTLGVDPDGENINLHCGSLYPQAMQVKVKEVNADLGIALDGDADRVIFCDEKAQMIDGDQILCALAFALQAENQLKRNTVVATIMSNMGLEKALASKGIQMLRTPVGDRYVVEEMLKNGYNFGGEPSGHILLMDHNTTGDGMVTALQILALMRKTSRPLSELTKNFQVFPQHIISVKVREKPDLESHRIISPVLTKANAHLKDEGRVIVRYSGTESVARVMVEGRSLEKVEMVAQEIAQVLQSQIGVLEKGNNHG